MIKKNKYYSIEVKHKKFKSLSYFLFYKDYDIFIKYFKIFYNDNWTIKTIISDKISFENYIEYKKILLNIEDIEIPDYIDTIKDFDTYLKDKHEL